MSQVPQPPPVAPPAAAPAPAAVPAVSPEAKVHEIIISDYRAFPAGLPCKLRLEGKNLLVHGENGSGKSSLFRAFRDLAAIKPGPVKFEELRHAFGPSTDGAIALQMTSGTPSEFRWDYGESHPRETQGEPYRMQVSRYWFLDYKALLETHFIHRDATPNLFGVLVTNILQELPVIVNGTTKRLGDVYDQMLAAHPGRYHGKRKMAAVNTACSAFNDALRNHLGSIVSEGCRLMRKMGYERLTFDLKPDVVRYCPKKKDFVHRRIWLSVTMLDKPLPHPQLFLNESRLTALALAIYLGAASHIMKPGAAGADGTVKGRLLVLDDVLIGLDIANRLPVLRVLNEDFEDWQVVLMTYDRLWFELAKDHLPRDKWRSQRLIAELMHEGWEKPVLLDDHDHMEEAWEHIQAGDYAAAAVYLRTAFEAILQGFCEHRQLAIPFRRDARDYTTEDYWPLVRNFLLKKGHPLVDALLAEEIKVCRRYVLNPLCHNDPGRPNREEVRSSYSAIRRLKVLLDQQLSWRKEFDGRLQAAVKPLIGDNAKLRERALNGLAPATEFALMCACQLLNGQNPVLNDVAGLLRCALDKALWDFAVRKGFRFDMRCDESLTTARVWAESVDGAGGLRGSQPAFVATVETHRDLLLDDAPCLDVLDAKTRRDLEHIATVLRGSSSPDNPKCVLSGW